MVSSSRRLPIRLPPRMDTFSIEVLTSIERRWFLAPQSSDADLHLRWQPARAIPTQSGRARVQPPDERSAALLPPFGSHTPHAML